MAPTKPAARQSRSAPKSPNGSSETEGLVPSNQALVVTREPSPLVNLTDDQWDLAKRVMAPGSTNDEFMLFRHWCQEQGYDPLLKQAYFTINRSKCPKCKADAKASLTCDNGCNRGWFRVPTFIASIDGLIARAARDPNFIAVDGAAVCEKDDFQFDALSNQPVRHMFTGERGRVVGAWSRLRRRDGTMVSFYYTVQEYTGGMVAEGKKGLMLLKAAQAILLRRTYPERNPNTYIPEEFGGYITEAGTLVLPEAAPVKQLAAPEDDHNPFDAVAEQVKVVEEQLAAPKATTSPATEKPAAMAGTAAAPATSSAAEPPPSIPSEPQAAPAQPVHKTTEGQVLDKDGIYTEGSVTYRFYQGKLYVDVRGTDVNKPGWYPADKLLSDKAKESENAKKLVAYFGQRVKTACGNDIHLSNHLKKHYRVGMVPALTFEQLAAILAFFEQKAYHPRFYAEEYAKAMAKAGEEPPIDESDAPEGEALEEFESVAPPADDKRELKMRLLFGVKGDDSVAKRFLAAVVELTSPEKFLAALKEAGWKWGAERDEELAGLAEMLADGQVDLMDIPGMLGA